MLHATAKFAPRSRRGAVGVLAAILLVAMIGMIVFAVDAGVIVLARTQLQCAADAAALAGTSELPNGPTAAQNAAQNTGQANTVGGAPVVMQAADDIEFGTWDKSSRTFSVLTGSAQANANAIRATCRVNASRGNALSLFFGRLFMPSVDISARAVAAKTLLNCGPFVGLNYVTISGGSYTDSYDSDYGPYSAGSAGSKGHTCSNGNISLSGGSTRVHGDAHPGKGYTVSCTGGAAVTGSETPLTETLNEPAVNPGSAATVNNNSSIPLSHFGKKPLDSVGDFTLSGGDSVTLPPGTYYFAKMTLSGGSTITVSGATTIYCTSDVNLSGGSVTNTTQIPANLQLYGMGSKVVLSGATQTYGVVYAPGADITRSGGSSDFFGMMVGKSLTLSGGGGLHYDEGLRALMAAQGSTHLVQ